jgi:hypothetical protein
MASSKLNHKPRHDQRQATPKNRPPPNSNRQCTSNPWAPKSRQAGGRTWPALIKVPPWSHRRRRTLRLGAQPKAEAPPERHSARTRVLHKCVSPKMMLSRKKRCHRRRYRRPANPIWVFTLETPPRVGEGGASTPWWRLQGGEQCPQAPPSPTPTKARADFIRLYWCVSSK